MAVTERSGASSSARSKQQALLRPPVAAIDAVDDLYETNAFGDEDEGVETAPVPVATGKQERRSSPCEAQAAKASSNNRSPSSGVQFDVWVARKDKYERMAQALAELNVERAADDERWLAVAVSLAATDCALKTGRSERCDCPGVCRNATHAVMRQRTRCQCPAKKCSLCGRCINTTPGQITAKMADTLAAFRSGGDTSVPARALLPSAVLSLADQIVTAGEGKCLSPGALKISRAAVRMAQTVLAQCSVVESVDGGSGRAQRPCSCPLRSLGELWVKWTTRYHTFSRAPLTEKEAAQFAVGTRQMMEHSEDEPDRYYMTLKWHQAAKPQKGDTAKIAARRALTPDQKKQNALFLTLCKRYWKQAQHRVVEHLLAKLGEFDKLPSGRKEQLTAVLASSIAAGAFPSSSSSSFSTEVLAGAALELQALNKLGVKRMLQWVEEDAEAVEAQKRDEHKEKTEGGIAAHNAWVRRKDRLRIRMPTPTKTEQQRTKPLASSARFDFSSKGAVRRKDFKAPSTTVELMRNSGLKYVHAMNDGFQGRGGDLDKCRQLLVKQGHVLRANFSDSNGGGNDDDDGSAGFTKDRYRFERANNPAVKKRSEGDKARKQQSQASFAAWTAHKALRDKALKFLEHLPRPSPEHDESNGNDAFDTAMTKWEQVGRALKAVDRTLLEAWVRWTGSFRAAATCRALWESFPPVACDVHCPSSALRDVFLKLLHRRGVHYRQAFADHCERKYKRAIARRDNGDGDDELPDDLTEQQQMERFAAMTRREFTRFLGDQGIIVQPEETQRLVEYFGDEQEGGQDGQEETVSMPKFLAVVGDERRVQCHGDTDVLLRSVCMWETVCHECGMLRAFQLVVSNTSSASGGSSSSSGGSRLRAELPGHAKRREQRGARFACSPECDLRVVKQTAPTPCAFSQWSDELALPFLKKLELWSAAPREQRVLQQLVTSGQPPDMPMLNRVDFDGDNNSDSNTDSESAVDMDATTSLLLRWAPPRAAGTNGAAFYQLETSGAEGSASFRRNEFREICRDPRDFSDNGGKPRCQFLVTGLAPNTKYAFRVRALNGFGAGPYAFAYVVTAPAAPPTPVAVKVSASSIALAWDASRSYQRQLRELRRAFDAADADGDGVISRDEFMDQLERRQPRLLEFLQRVTVAGDASKSAAGASAGPPLSVFDAIETDDSESLSWTEFLGFFHGVLSVDDAADGGDNESDDESVAAGTARLSRTSSRSQPLLGASVSSKTTGASTTRKRVASVPGAGASRFILKQCTNEANGEYVEIYRGAAPSFVVHGLASGSTFQFRVQAENEEGRRSLHSAPVVVNTLLPTPPPPAECGVSSSAAKLKWSVADARPSMAFETLQHQQQQQQRSGGGGGQAMASKQSDDVSRLLKEWAMETSVDDGSVDFRARFDRLDADKSGYIELPEFRSLLTELGVAPSDERLAAYLAEFDTDADGRISFAEFARWWSRADDVQYVLKRDRGQRDADAAAAASTASDMAVVSYRGKDTSAVVAGLEPNTLYRFRLRVVASHASSQLSDALELWTSPAAPTRAGRVSVSCTSVLLRWHAGAHGAHKFLVECKLVETLPSSTGVDVSPTGGSGRSASVNSGGWTRVYEGGESFAAVGELMPSTVYRVCVIALNRVGGASEQSTVTQICTPSCREEERAAGGGPMRPANAAEHFTVECAAVGDLVLGDAVLFCERLYRSSSSSSVGGGAGVALQPSNSLANASVCSASSGAVAVGERTVAARVVGVRTDDKHGRVLSMVVLWSTAQLYDDVSVGDRSRASRSNSQSRRPPPASSLLAAGHALATDLKISRREKSLYRFDTFRKEWLDERARLEATWESQ